MPPWGGCASPCSHGSHVCLVAGFETGRRKKTCFLAGSKVRGKKTSRDQTVGIRRIGRLRADRPKFGPARDPPFPKQSGVRTPLVCLDLIDPV